VLVCLVFMMPLISIDILNIEIYLSVFKLFMSLVLNVMHTNQSFII